MYRRYKAAGVVLGAIFMAVVSMDTQAAQLGSDLSVGIASTFDQATNTEEQTQVTAEVVWTGTPLEGYVNIGIANVDDNLNIREAADEAEAQAEGEREAYLATGGDPDEYVPTAITADYDVKYQGERYLSFVVTVTQTRATAWQQTVPCTVDLETGEDVTLQDLLGEDWRETVNASVKEQIAQRSQDPANTYWDGSDGMEGFTSIRDDQPFYLDADGDPVVLFDEYEIAPGYMGIQTFKIPR